MLLHRTGHHQQAAGLEKHSVQQRAAVEWRIVLHATAIRILLLVLEVAPEQVRPAAQFKGARAAERNAGNRRIIAEALLVIRVPIDRVLRVHVEIAHDAVELAWQR